MKEKHISGYRVVIDPYRPISEKDAQATCERIKAQAKRHIDDVGYIAIEHDVEYTCSYCGCEWEDNPDCCADALNEWAANAPELYEL